MSKQIGETERGTSVNLFHGGKDRGKMVQITNETGFIQVPITELGMLAFLLGAAWGEAQK